MNANWFETFFAGVALDLWRATNSAEQTAQEADFLMQRLQLKPGDHALDVPCGNGRHAIELAHRGVRMTGVDISTGFLEEARRAAPSIEWIQSDMRDLPWKSRFDAAFCWGNSFGYFDHECCLHFLQAVARALKPGGHFIVETGLVAESILPHLQSERQMQIGDISFASRNIYNPAEGRLDITYTFIRGNEHEIKATQQWVHSAAEIRRMLRQSSLEPLELYGDANGSPYTMGCPLLILLARRAD